MVMTASVMIVLKMDRPASERAMVLMSGDSSSAVQWVINCRWGKGKERSGRTVVLLGVLEQIGGWCFQAAQVRAVENTKFDETTRWRQDEIQMRLAQKLGVERTEMCSEVFLAPTHSDELRSGLGRRMRKVEGCG